MKHPPVVEVRCGVCRRPIRDVTLDGAGRIVVLGSVELERGEGARMQMVDPVTGRPRRVRAARCVDASPGGWTGGEPTRWRFVCAHRRGPDLDRPVSEGRLRELCAAAAASGTPIVLR